MHGDIVCERARLLHADDPHVFADVLPPGAAGLAGVAGDMRLARNAVADLPAVDHPAEPHDLTGEFMAKDHWQPQPLLRVGRPVVDVHIRAADRRGVDLDEHLIFFDLRKRQVRAVYRTGSRLRFYDSVHMCSLLWVCALLKCRDRRA